MAQIDSRLRSIGERVRVHRAYVGLTQQEVASAVRLTRASIANMEAGRQSVSLIMVMDIARVLQTSVGVLIGEVDDPIAEQMAEVVADLALRESEAEAAALALRQARQRVRVMGLRPGEVEQSSDV